MNSSIFFYWITNQNIIKDRINIYGETYNQNDYFVNINYYKKIKLIVPEAESLIHFHNLEGIKIHVPYFEINKNEPKNFEIIDQTVYLKDRGNIIIIDVLFKSIPRLEFLALPSFSKKISVIIMTFIPMGQIHWV